MLTNVFDTSMRLTAEQIYKRINAEVLFFREYRGLPLNTSRFLFPFYIQRMKTKVMADNFNFHVFLLRNN